LETVVVMVSGRKGGILWQVRDAQRGVAQSLRD
jgi:hypothetical protein